MGGPAGAAGAAGAAGLVAPRWMPGCLASWLCVLCALRCAPSAAVLRSAHRQPAHPAVCPAVPHERDQWQQPQAAFSISDRGKAAAAVELAKELQVGGDKGSSSGSSAALACPLA